MRIIKFRGKDRYDGIWHYGSLIVNGMFGHTHIWDASLGYMEVDPKTVGQFTGLMDKHGEWIYEGDILTWEKDGLMYVVKFRKGMFYASVEESNEGILGGFPLHALTVYEDRKCEIVGNKFDNPELLKGGAK